MTQETILVLTALVFLNVKHTLADFFLQFEYQYKNKGTYGHPGGLLHSFIHIICSVPVFIILPLKGFTLILLILAGEFILHYHIDWLKVNVNKRFDLHYQTSGFWLAVGVDQLGHQLTYLAMVAVLLAY